MLAMIDDEASFESIHNDLQQFEEEEQAGHAEQQVAGDMLRHADGSVPQWLLRLPCLSLTCFRFEEGTQLRRCSPGLFGRCSGHLSRSTRDCAGLAASCHNFLETPQFEVQKGS
jgi:hypothetical protein